VIGTLFIGEGGPSPTTSCRDEGCGAKNNSARLSAVIFGVRVPADAGTQRGLWPHFHPPVGEADVHETHGVRASIDDD